MAASVTPLLALGILSTVGAHERAGVSVQRIHRHDAGVTLVELLATLGILATLALIAVPVYVSAKAMAQQRTCFQNQSTLARATELYLAVDPSFDRTDLAGIVTADHPVVVNHIVNHPPRCLSGDPVVDPEFPTLAEGAYQFDETGNLMGCTLGALSPHGRFDD